LEKYSQPVTGSVPTIIRTYKAAVSRRARQELGVVYFWQRNYYEHIIRNELEFKDIAGYISANEVTWSEDPEYPQ
jgi:REP element-mobilizing transposase RayT